MGVYAAIALACDPLAALPLAVAFLALLLTEPNRREALAAAGTVAALGLVLLVYLLATHSLADLYAQAILFNSQVYTRYYHLRPYHLMAILRNILTGLNILSPREWLQPAAGELFAGYSSAEQFLFTGFVYRLGVLVFTFSLFLRRKWLAGSFVYIFISTTLLRQEAAFRQLAFVLLCLTCAGLFWSGELWERQSPLKGAPPSTQHWLTVTLSTATAVCLLGGLFWEGGRFLEQAWQNRTKLTYQSNFRPSELRAKEIRRLACGQEVALGIYPSNPLLYFFSKMKPVSRYVYVYPWVAEVANPEIIASLKTNPAIVQIEKSILIWNTFAVATYMGDVIRYLDDHYTVRGDFYLSPGLAACRP